MIIEFKPDTRDISGEQESKKSLTCTLIGTGLAEGENANIGGSLVRWHIPRIAIQGKTFITAKAGASDRQVAEAEQIAFERLQAASAPDSYGFWLNPEEDIYEDLQPA
jgi:hypothetical protein